VQLTDYQASNHDEPRAVNVNIPKQAPAPHPPKKTKEKGPQILELHYNIRNNHTYS
jgi:hypothetical protein